MTTTRVLCYLAIPTGSFLVYEVLTTILAARAPLRRRCNIKQHPLQGNIGSLSQTDGETVLEFSYTLDYLLDYPQPSRTIHVCFTHSSIVFLYHFQVFSCGLEAGGKHRM